MSGSADRATRREVVEVPLRDLMCVREQPFVRSWTVDTANLRREVDFGWPDDDLGDLWEGT